MHLLVCVDSRSLDSCDKRKINDITDLHDVLKCAPVDISLRTGLSVCSDFSHINLKIKDD